MLSIHNLNKEYGAQPVLKNIQFNISSGSRIGLIGANGSGKSTLMRILAGLEKPDSGDVVSTRPNLRIGYLAQGMDFMPEQTLLSALELDPALQTDPALEVESLAMALSQQPDDPMIQQRYDSALARLAEPAPPHESILGPLGLARLPLDTPVAHLSGGQKTRLMLAQVLLKDPHLLLLDEPTNHLDIEMLQWLESWIGGFRGGVLIVSHDRVFLDNTVSSILELDASTHEARMFDGNYSSYMEAREREHQKQYQEYQDQVIEIQKLHNAARHLRRISQFKEGGKGDTRDKFAKGFFGDRTKHTARRALRIENRIEKILGEDRKEKPKKGWGLKLNLGEPDHQSKDVLVTEALSIGYDTPLIEHINLFIRANQRVVLTGPNGAGKTSFIRTIAGSLPPLGGSFRLGGAVKPGYMAQEQELLRPQLSALQSIQAVAAMNETEARNFLHFFLFKGDAALRPAGELSYGERARLQLALLVAEGCNFLILDEPINHLDIPSRERFEEALENFKGTILAVVHDRSFIEHFATDVWLAKDGRIVK